MVAVGERNDGQPASCRLAQIERNTLRATPQMFRGFRLLADYIAMLKTETGGIALAESLFGYGPRGRLGHTTNAILLNTIACSVATPSALLSRSLQASGSIERL